LKTIIIPKLRKYLNFEEKATHKLSRAAKTVDEDVILKIPCTIALVKLLKKMPKSEGENSIRSIIPSLCAGLRNELLSVRNTLRKTLLNVIKELGISHFRIVISYLKSSLLRGYQKHVLNYTVGYLMKCLESDFKRNPEQLPIKEVLPLCEEELYSIMQEEKELAAIKAKTREAAKSNAHPILKLCAKCIQSKDNLRTLIDPAVKHLLEKRSPKIIKTTRQWLNSVGEGLADNIVIDHIELVEWLKEVMNKESLEEEKNRIDAPETKKRKLLVETKDALLIHTSKKKAAADSKIAGQFLLTEFSFSSLFNGLNKSSRMKNELVERDGIQVLDGFVKNLSEGIHCSSKQVLTLMTNIMTCVSGKITIIFCMFR
jgi:U3 small nucleolar RNA-associated protein 20